MGGLGSGRHWHWNTKNTVTDYRALDVRRWARDGLLKPGNRFGWQWTVDGEKTGSIQVAVERKSVRLTYRCKENGGDWEDLEYPVWLTSTPCNYGGERQWFVCPASGCGRRVAKLYGGRIFACRHCHQLAYPSQREKSYDRAARKADKIRARLGWDLGLEGLPRGRPKGMHRKTYERLSAQVWELSVEAEEGFAAHFAFALLKLDPKLGGSADP